VPFTEYVVVRVVPVADAGLPPTAVQVNVYGGVPPVADAVNVTEVPTVPVVGPLTVTTGGVDEITIVTSLKTLTPLLSVTVPLTVYDPLTEYVVVKLEPVPEAGLPPKAVQKKA
jgi:hypothetical protein